MHVKFYVCRYSVCAKKEGCTIGTKNVLNILSFVAFTQTCSEYVCDVELGESSCLLSEQEIHTAHLLFSF